VAKFDTEDLLASILSIMTTGGALNAKITAIEAEKAAKSQTLVPGLSSIGAADYYEQTWSNKILNSPVAIFYGVENVQASDGGGVVAKTYTVFVEVVMTDNGQTNDIHKRIARYSRALEEVFNSAFDSVESYGKVKVDQVRPISFKLELDSDEEIKVGGVSLTITLV